MFQSQSSDGLLYHIGYIYDVPKIILILLASSMNDGRLAEFQLFVIVSLHRIICFNIKNFATKKKIVIIRIATATTIRLHERGTTDRIVRFFFFNFKYLQIAFLTNVKRKRKGCNYTSHDCYWMSVYFLVCLRLWFPFWALAGY